MITQTFQVAIRYFPEILIPWKLSGNFLGKNPEDVWDFKETVWDIPNVKSHHPEKTLHPCQFPIELIQRLTLALTDKSDVVIDPFAGVHSAGCAAAFLNRLVLGVSLKAAEAQLLI